jgi:hypothetical protein
MDDRERKDEERTEEPESPEALEDLDVPEEDSEDLKGGTYYSFKQAWPKKYDGG